MRAKYFNFIAFAVFVMFRLRWQKRKYAEPERAGCGTLKFVSHEIFCFSQEPCWLRSFSISGNSIKVGTNTKLFIWVMHDLAWTDPVVEHCMGPGPVQTLSQGPARTVWNIVQPEPSWSLEDSLVLSHSDGLSSTKQEWPKPVWGASPWLSRTPRLGRAWVDSPR